MSFDAGRERVEERRDSAADVRRESAGLGGAGRDEVRELRLRFSAAGRVASGRESGAGLAMGSGIVILGVAGGVSGLGPASLRVGVVGGEGPVRSNAVFIDAVVGVTSSSAFRAAADVGDSADDVDVEDWSPDGRFLWTLLRIWSGVRRANSCALRRGGGINGEPGEGKGDEDAMWSTERERRGTSAIKDECPD